MNLIECVPNISEGKDQTMINAIAAEIKKVDNVCLLHVDSNEDANRTVFTFVGPPQNVLTAAFLMYQKTFDFLDMSKQSGAHPRIGAVDVCPFVPLGDVNMNVCIDLANQLGDKIGNELKVPVYLYEKAAKLPDRQNLAIIRKGGYEGLYIKLQNVEWTPDYGPSKMNKKSGATVIGARNILIAFNINLDTKDLLIAKKIAREIRTSGTFERNENGKIKYDQDGFPHHIPGRLKACKAIGWSMPGYGFNQISTNLINYKETPPHLVYETCKSIAQSLGVKVTGSELIGLIPSKALKIAGQYYMEGSQTCSDDELINKAIQKMGLNSIKPFNPEERIIENKIHQKQKGNKQ